MMTELLLQAIVEVEKAHAYACATTDEHPAIEAIYGHLTTARMYIDDLKAQEGFEVKFEGIDGGESSIKLAGKHAKSGGILIG